MEIFFVTASKTETQGLTVNEALAASLPVVCIEDESYKYSCNLIHIMGIYLKKRKKYIDKVISLYKDKELYNSMSKQAEDFSSKFSQERFADSILEVIKKAIDKERIVFIYKIKILLKE